MESYNYTLKDEPEIELSQCEGHCCREFYIETIPHKTFFDLRASPEREGLSIDYDCRQFIITHLQPLGHPDMWGEKGIDGRYKCKSYDVTKDNCMSYETRPAMCSAYPYGKECHVGGCTRFALPSLPIDA